ncbi:uncharacterized protein [Ptychodera flava]|uniref:uncharacterized protein n=1 Tax=Ptychodera flava TaxID=63121 RepID=UPI00396A3230
MTSRVGTEWDDWFQTITTLVQPLTPEDSALYLIRHTKSPSTLQEANYTLEKLKSSNREEYDALMWLGGEEGLHGLPLALKQARNYISKNNVTFKKYKQMYEKCKLGMLERDHDRGLLEGWMKLHDIDMELESTLQTCIQKHAHEIKTFSEETLQDDEFKMTKDQAAAVKRAIDETSSQDFVEIADLSRMNVVTTWKINYEETVKGKHTKEFLQLCSCLTTRIQTALLVDGARYLNPGALRDFIIPRQGIGRYGTKQMIEKNTRLLFQYIKHFSFATYVTKSEECSHARSLVRMGEYTVHHLLQLAVFTRFISKEEKVQCLNNAMSILENLFPKLREIQDGSTGVLHDRHSIIALHAQALAEKIILMENEELTDLNEINAFFSAVSNYLFRLGRPRDAKLICKAMVQFREGRKPVDKLKLAEVLSYLGECYFEMGKLKKAEETIPEEFDVV